MIQFEKGADEQYMISLDFSAMIPEDTSIYSATASAIDVTDEDSDATATILDEEVVGVNGKQVLPFMQAGEIGHRYEVTLTLELTPGIPTPTLVKKFLMIVTR